MGRGDHPMRTPFYGLLLIAGAMVLATVVGYWTHPATILRDLVWALCLLAALTGFVLTFRDLTPGRRR